MHDDTLPDDVPTRKRRKGIYILPNLFTLAALFGGFYSVVMAMNARFDLAAVGVFCAMVLDSLDGRVARMTNTQSAFGEQMDSLSDMVSFGAAPAWRHLGVVVDLVVRNRVQVVHRADIGKNCMEREDTAEG